MTDYDPYSKEQIRFLRKDPTGDTNPVTPIEDDWEYRISEQDGIEAAQWVLVAIVISLLLALGVWFASTIS